MPVFKAAAAVRKAAAAYKKEPNYGTAAALQKAQREHAAHRADTLRVVA